MDELCGSPWQERVRHVENMLKKGLEPCRKVPGVSDVRVLGAIGVVETTVPVDVEAWQNWFVSKGVWIRPFGRTVYIMPPFIISDDELCALTDELCSAVRSAAVHGGVPVMEEPLRTTC